MRIAILSCDAHPNNGWGVITLNYCRQLYKAGIDFTLFLPRHHTKLDEDWSDQIAYYLPRVHLKYGDRRTILDAALPLAPFRGFDLIHSLFEIPTAFPAYRAANKYDRPFVMGAQGTYGVVPFLNWLDRRIFTRILNRADMFITPSNFTRRIMLAFHGTDEFKNKTRVIHNGIEFSRFHEKAIAWEKKDAGVCQFVGVGALKARKGFDICIRAFKDVVSRHKNVEYKIIGGGSKQYREYLENLVRAFGLTEHVFFMGELTGDKLVAQMAKSYAYVHTPISQNWNFEGFGIVYVEANACGLPAIGSDSGGVPDAIVDGKTGLLTREYDVHTTTEAINLLLEEPQQREYMSINAIEWARQHDWSQIVQQYIDCYKELI